MKIGILYICTGKYSIFWKDFYLSMEKNFIKNSEKHYFVFTDNSKIDFEEDNPRIHRIYQEDLGWPNNTLMRFHIFLKQEKELENMDYLFFFNANLLIEKEIIGSEFLPISENLLATIHPGFYNKKRTLFTYENNKKSTAFINKNQGEYYFAGGLNGGKTKAFIEAMKSIRDNVDTDNKNNIIAKWHDESHWNKYLLNRIDIKILQPSYLYPEGWSLPFSSIILIRDKNKYGGHNLLRNKKEDNDYKIFIKKIAHKILKRVKKIIKKYFGNRNSLLSNIKEFDVLKTDLLIITIAFNNVDVIKSQNFYLKKYLKDDFKYLIVDNSTNKEISLDIYNYCNLNNIYYTKIPENIFETNPSKSHGAALNWTYNNIIKENKPLFFGFLDHDIFPFRETNIISYLKEGVFGLIQEKNDKWYLWPGFCFYEYSKIQKYKLDFMPCTGLDTGGKNYYSLYKKIYKEKIIRINQLYINIKNKNIEPFVKEPNETIEILNDWVHLMKTTNWDNTFNDKSTKIDKIIEISSEILG